MYNNPFLYNPSNLASVAPASKGLLASIKAINWGGILSNTQKTLGIINQTIPIVYQVKPMMNNARTMLKIASSLKGDNNKNKSLNSNNISTNINSQGVNISNISTQNNTNPIIDYNKPYFFI